MEVDLNRIISLRGHLKLTQDEVAAALNIGRTTYVSREKAGNFSKEEVEKLAALFKVQVSELYKRGVSIVVEESIDRLTEIAVRTESLQKAILLGITKLISYQTGISDTKILEDLTSVANLQSVNYADELKRLAEI